MDIEGIPPADYKICLSDNYKKLTHRKVEVFLSGRGTGGE